MAKQDVLFDLVRSLTKNEKGYFRKYTSKTGQASDKNYLLLFDAIDKQSQWDEPALVKKFSKGKFMKNFSEAKGYLRTHLLKALKEYHHKKSVKALIRENLDYVELLYNRGLYNLCAKYLTQTLKQTIQWHQQSYQLEVLAWQRKLVLQKKGEGIAEALTEIRQSEMELFLSIQEEVQYQQSYARLSELSRYKANLDLEELRLDMADHMPDSQTGSTGKSSFFSQLIANRIQAFYHQLARAYDKAFPY